MKTEREAFEAWHMDEFGWNDAENPEWLKRFRTWQASRKVALEECAKRSDAYQYLGKNFNALAEEVRRMK